MKKLACLLALLPAFASAQISRPSVAPSTGGGSSTLTAGSTPTSGCTDGGFLYSLSNLLQCGANAINDGSVITLGGVAGSGDNVVITNGTSTRSILLLKDNTTTVFTVADGGAVTAATNTFTISGSSAVLTVASSNAVIGSTSAAFSHANAATNTLIQTLSSGLNSAGTAATGFGNGIKWQLESSTTNNSDAGVFGIAWSDATHASRTSRAVVQTVNNAGALADAFSIGSTTVASASGIAVIANATIISGSTNIDSITAKNPGFIVTLIFQGVLTVNDASNLKLAGNFTTTADDTLTLICDGTNWIEIARSVN